MCVYIYIYICLYMYIYIYIYCCHAINGMCIQIIYDSGTSYIIQETTYTRTTFVLARTLNCPLWGPQLPWSHG